MLGEYRFCFIVTLTAVAVSCGGTVAFQSKPTTSSRTSIWNEKIAATQDDVALENSVEESDETKPCFYRPPNGWWKQRINLVDLSIGQPLNGTIAQELLEAKTGPKLFFECGVGRIDSKGDWKIVNGMLRFLKKGTKKSVVRKKAMRLRKRDQVELFVSRILVDSSQFEVCLSMEEVEEFQKNAQQRISASALEAQQELVGTVVRICPYGVMVDVGANRNGLLHISKVADLYGRYIDKEKGLEEAGLEVGAKIRLVVFSNERKRLEFDFTPDVKIEAEKERKQQEEERQKRLERKKATRKEKKTTPKQETELTTQDPYDISEEEAEEWAAYSEEAAYDEDTDEGYDEDRDIEDALGLGTY